MFPKIIMSVMKKIQDISPISVSVVSKLVYLPIRKAPKRAPYVKPAIPKPSSITGLLVLVKDTANIININVQTSIKILDILIESALSANLGKRSNIVDEDNADKELLRVLMAAEKRPAIMNPVIPGGRSLRI